MNEVPKVSKLVMFRHGVAYVERSGAAAGDFEVSFKRDEMNDVLKSLSVWVARGSGRVGAVAFEAPDDPNQALQERNLLLDPREVATGLLLALRGRRVSVDAQGQLIEGEVIGLEETPGGGGSPRRQLVLRTGDDRVALVDLATTSTVMLSEGPSRSDLAFLVDRSRAASAGSSRSVRVQLDGSADDLRIAYVIPSPVWRVSYRLAVEGEDTTLMAWGIVHNPVDEDLDDVTLVLTTGQPISFVIDLYNAKRVQRTVVEETSRVAAAPTHYERAPRARSAPMHAMAAPAPPPGMGPSGYGGMMPPAPPAPAPSAMPTMADGFAAAAEDAASGEDRGELFEYRLSAPVSLKRGGSAMVPLATAKPAARKERIWRDGSGPNPDLVLTFTNDSGLVLEEGPVVIYDEGSYAGEAMLPYSARSAEVKLAFAKDLAVRCRHDTTVATEMVGVRLGDQALVQEQRQARIHQLRADSDHDDEVKVIFELRKTTGHDVDGEIQPFEETASYWRFEARAPAHGKATLEVREVWRTSMRIEYQSVSAGQLLRWLEARYLDDATFQALNGMRNAWEQAARLDQRRGEVERDRDQGFAKLSKLSEQLAVLKDSGDEGRLRLRYVKELGDEQTRVNELEEDIRSLRASAAGKRAEAEEQLRQLTGR